MNDWCAIFETDLLYQAQIVKDMLESNGIEAVILNQQDSAYKFGTIKVMINQHYENKAIEILKSTHCE